MKINLRTDQRGDTIIAILLSIAIIGLVVALAYFLINRSFALNLNARQRNQVIKIVQGQIEGLKSLAVSGATGSNDIFDIDGYKNNKNVNTESTAFCLDVDNQVILKTGMTQYKSTTAAAGYDKCAGLEDITSLESAEVELTITYTADPNCVNVDAI